MHGVRDRAGLMCLSAFIACGLLAGCGPKSPASDPGDVSANGEASDVAGNGNDVPMFQIDKNAAGPLTMDELKFRIPESVGRYLDDNAKACYRGNVAALAEQAGDPETLDPKAFDGLGLTPEWQNLNRFNKRVILAQAITSRAIHGCM